MKYLHFILPGFWYGAKLIRDEGYNIGNVIIVSTSDERVLQKLNIIF